MASIRFDPTLRLNGLLTLRSLRPTRTAAGFAVPRRARLLTLDDRAYFRLRNGALVDDAGDSVDMPTAFKLAETEAVLRAEAAAAGRSRLRAIEDRGLGGAGILDRGAPRLARRLRGARRVSADRAARPSSGRVVADPASAFLCRNRRGRLNAVAALRFNGGLRQHGAGRHALAPRTRLR